MQPFAEFSLTASNLLSQLKTVKDSVCFHEIQQNGDYIFAFIATLDTSEEICMAYNVTCDNTPIYALSELPPPMLAAYGLFVARVEEWQNGGELHESLRHDD